MYQNQTSSVQLQQAAAQEKAHQSSKGLTEIERLQAQHAEHRKRVELIRQEFVRIATG